MKAACIDLEGVLIPELWPILAEACGIPELKITTRDEPDFIKLMQQRLNLLRVNSLRHEDILRHIAGVRPFPGAVEFLAKISNDHSVVLVSDAFRSMISQFVRGLSATAKLECHEFDIDVDGYIERCRYAPRKGKRDVVLQLKSQGFEVLAVGDAFNDLDMLAAADSAFLFRPTLQTASAAAGLTLVNEYEQILALL